MAVPCAAWLFSISLLVTACLFQVSAQNCDRPTFEDVNGIFEKSLERIISNIAREEISLDVSISEFSLTCLSVSEMRGKFRLATSLIRFTFGGVTSFNGCVENAICTGLFSFECDDRDDEWAFNPLLVSQSLRILPDFNGTFDTPPRLDCGSCNEQILLPNSEHDPSTNCFSCHPDCQGVGLSYCSGLTADTCCSFYEYDMCVSECSPRRVPNEDNDCVCQNNFLEPNCTDVDPCSLQECLNEGTCILQAGNAVCLCQDGFEGDLCEINRNECQLQPCLNGGRCTDGINSFTCDCLPGFTGETCSVEVNCASQPCLNEGNCTDTGDSFECSCTANFKGMTCETCDIAYCTVCSQEVGKCLTCDDNFKQGFGMQGCVPDSRSSCANASMPLQCQFEQDTALYNLVSFSCSIQPVDFPEYSDTDSDEERFNSSLNYYRSLASNWLDQAMELNILTSDTITRPNTEEPQGFIDEWRLEVNNYLASIMAWTKYYRETFGVEVPSLPQVDIENDDPKEVYQLLTTHWSSITHQFTVQTGAECGSTINRDQFTGTECA